MKINILSFNLRCNTPNDGDHAWPYRQDKVIAFLHGGHYDFMGFQEVTPDMYDTLRQALKDYDSYGISRSEGSEATPIFVHKSHLVMDHGTFWLTETPFVSSKLPCSVFPRIATYVIVDCDGKKLALFNAHLDYQDPACIYNQAEYLYHMMRWAKDRYQAKLFLTGDFNQYPDSMAIRFLSSRLSYTYNGFKEASLTFHNYSEQTIGQPIDYIFHEASVTCLESCIVRHEGIMLSDHYPVQAVFELK